MPSVMEAPEERRTTLDAPEDEARTTAVVRRLALVQAAVAALDYTNEALAVAMGKKPEYRAYVHRVLSGEKPMSWEFFDALPEDVRAEYHSLEATARGRIVARPASCREEAAQLVLSGLLTLLNASPQLPARADRMAKMERRSGQDRRKVG